MDAGGIAPLIRMVQSNHLDCQSKASGAIRSDLRALSLSPCLVVVAAAAVRRGPKP